MEFGNIIFVCQSFLLFIKRKRKDISVVNKKKRDLRSFEASSQVLVFFGRFKSHRSYHVILTWAQGTKVQVPK